MTEKYFPSLDPNHELKKLLLRMSHSPEGVIALHENGKQEQTFDFLKRGLRAESTRVIRVDISEVFAKFPHSGRLFGDFLFSKIGIAGLGRKHRFSFLCT